jgi:RNA polymerase sigma-70 factor (ECF subfamily)
VNDKKENNVTDRPLVEKVLRGNTEAFKIIIKNTEGLVAQIIFKMIPNSEDRKDIAQDVYLKTFQNLQCFKFQSKLSTWIGQIAYNTCVNYLEKKKLVLLDNTNNEDETKERPLAILNNRSIDISSNETENLIFRKEISAILKTELDKLAPLYKTLITLYHNEEMSYAEIGQITDLPEGTVKNYLFRARNKLRDNLLLTYKKEEL